MKSLRLLLTLALFVAVAFVITFTPAAAGNGGHGQISVHKWLCTSIDQGSCDGNDTSLADYEVKFEVHSGNTSTGSTLQTIHVTLGKNANGSGNLGGGSQGIKDGGALASGAYTVCELPSASKGTETIDLIAHPLPQGSHQSASGSNCITVQIGNGKAELKFLDAKDSQTISDPVTPTSTPTATPTETPVPPTDTPVTPTNTPDVTVTPTDTAVPPTSTPDPSVTPAETPTQTNNPEATNTPVTPTSTPTNTPETTATTVAPANTPTAQPTQMVSGSEATKVPTATKTPKTTVASANATKVPTATPSVTQLPKTGEPVDGSLALAGLVLSLIGALAYRLAAGQRPTAVPARIDTRDSNNS